MGSNGDDTNSPDAAVSVEIGGTGIAIFGFLLFLIALSLITAKNKYSRLLFISSAIMSILEIPRYVALVVDRAYTCQTTYMFHLIGSVFFFLSFSFVCYLLHDAVDMSHATTPLLNTMQPAGLAEKMIFDKQVLILMNGVFAALAVTTCIVCLLYSSLYAFFEESRLFFLFTIVDATKNIMFGGTVIYYGQRLRERIMRFASNSAGFESPSEAALIIKLRTAVRKLLVVMVICNFCFWLRVAMLILKLVLVERNDDRISSLPWLPPYGLLWWWLDDFLPR